MCFPEQQVRVFLYGAPVDMRRSFDGLYAIARHGMRADPLAGHLFAFINRVWAKRLEQGRFLADWKRVVTREIDLTQLKLLLEGIEVVRQRHRYRHPQPQLPVRLSP
ncbi:transposase [Trinickia sp. LjRoot230]|uniref:IS66 family insertion sequence element accessory protein TnpB n=1 Tax=Trinickia sp. LjRoot230 TaxID=3342288 RepID=UPI003ECFA57F